MRKRLLHATFVVLLATTAAEPCGDKLLSLGHLRAGRAFKANQPASVLMFRGSNSSPIPAKTENEFLYFLHQAGHRVTIAYTPAELEKLVASNSVDVLLLDTRDIDGVEGVLRPLAVKPSVVAVLYKPSKAAFAASEQRCRWAVSLPAKPGPLLATIDSAALAKLSQAKAARN